jgi:molybdopterin-synthase adenylyltransferase
MNTDARYARHLALFGDEGQATVASTHAMIVGLGGLGSHVVQQLAYLGVHTFTLIDEDDVDESNLNRLIGAGPEDVGAAKVAVGQRTIAAIQPSADISIFSVSFTSDIDIGGEQAHVLFGCVDRDVARLALVQYSSAHAIPYIDLASDVTPSGEFGGRIVFAKDGERCLSCLGELDQHELARATMTDEQRAADDQIYGIDRGVLPKTGPSVVSINGVVASLAVTEFMAWRVGLREPIGYLNYRGDRGTVGTRKPAARTHCHYCMTLWPNAWRP